MKSIKILSFLFLVLLIFAFSGLTLKSDQSVSQKYETQANQIFNQSLIRNDVLFDKEVSKLSDKITKLDTIIGECEADFK